MKLYRPTSPSYPHCTHNMNKLFDAWKAARAGHLWELDRSFRPSHLASIIRSSYLRASLCTGANSLAVKRRNALEKAASPRQIYRRSARVCARSRGRYIKFVTRLLRDGIMARGPPRMRETANCYCASVKLDLRAVARRGFFGLACLEVPRRLGE